MDDIDLLAEISDDPDDGDSDYGRGYRDGYTGAEKNAALMLAAVVEAAGGRVVVAKDESARHIKLTITDEGADGGVTFTTDVTR